MSPHPRPILKGRKSLAVLPDQSLPFAACNTIQSPHVHFPPTPALVASTHPVHSPHTYDRRPIVRSPAVGVLPDTPDFEVERVERGMPKEGRERDSDVKGSYFHPRAYEACEPEDLDDMDSFLTTPALVRDTSPLSSSASDDSDESETATPPDPRFVSTITFLGDLPSPDILSKGDHSQQASDSRTLYSPPESWRA